MTETVAQQAFLNHLETLRDYWLGRTGNLSHASCETADRLDGFIHSLLTTFDGGNAAMPAFELVPYLSGEDPPDAYAPFDPGEAVDEFGDLHDLWHARQRAGRP